MTRCVEGIVVRAIGSESVLLNPTTGQYYGLNEVGQFIWTQLQRQVNEADILAALAERYGISGAEAEADYTEFLDSLEKSTLITR